eukprot:SAG22_NODE_710_length_7741_cov_108.460089_12_plen_69_part_00
MNEQKLFPFVSQRHSGAVRSAREDGGAGRYIAAALAPWLPSQSKLAPASHPALPRPAASPLQLDCAPS